MPHRSPEIARSLRQRIISGLHLGTLKPGMRLPSSRDLADEFGVTARTAMAAYRLLEGEELVTLRERSGIYVAGAENGPAAMLTQLARFAVDVLLDARTREIAPVEFPERMRRCLETLRLRAVCVAGNADQLDHICHELQGDYGVQSTGLEPEQLSEPDYEAQRALTHADLLVSTAVHAVRVKQLAHQLAKPMIAVSLRAGLWREMTRQLAQGPIYLVASDPRFREAARAVFEPTGFGNNARAVILGEDDPDQIPPDAPTYIMRRAHQRLGNSPLAQRVVPFRRIFSAEMSQELLTFIVRANIAAMAARMP